MLVTPPIDLSRRSIDWLIIYSIHSHSIRLDDAIMYDLGSDMWPEYIGVCGDNLL
jgi:hypothetical protein